MSEPQPDDSSADPGAMRLLPPRARLPIAAAAGVAFAVGIAVAFLAADVAHPAAIFPKYLAAAAAPPAVAAERLLDYSPLYLTLARAALRLATDPDRFLLVLQ